MPRSTLVTHHSPLSILDFPV